MYFGNILALNSWIKLPPLHPPINNIFCFIFGGKISQVGGSFGGNLENNE
jgi:hypothetical protein